MTLKQLIRQTKSKMLTAQDERDRSTERLKAMRDRLERGETVPDNRVREATREHDKLVRRYDEIREEYDDMCADQAEDERIAALQEQSTPTGVRMPGGAAVYVGGEPSTYTSDNERTGQTSFLRDLFAAQIKNDSGAHERLARHGREVEASMSSRAGVDTSMVPSFVPPAYIVDLFAEFARAGRPLANLLTSLPLPPTGMTVTIPKVTTPTTVGVQSTENTALSTQDPADTGIDVAVKTVGGYVPVSRQTLERGLLVEEMIFADLASAYAAQVDTLAITAALAQAGTNAVTFTSATPKVTELWPKLADAVGKVRSQRFAGPTALVMTPTRYAWMQAALSTGDDRPLLPAGASGPSNAMGVQTSTEYAGVVGQLLGVPVILDANLPVNLGTGTNEDAILVADFRDSILMEEANKAPTQLRFESVAPQNLTVHLVAYGYSAVTFARQPKSVSKIGGTGLAAPGAL